MFAYKREPDLCSFGKKLLTSTENVLFRCDCAPPNLSNYSMSINVTLEEMIKNSTESLSRAHSVNPKGMMVRVNYLAQILHSKINQFLFSCG